MAHLRGKTLWFSALALWLTASPVGGREAGDDAAAAPPPLPAMEEPQAATEDDLNLEDAE